MHLCHARPKLYLRSRIKYARRGRKGNGLLLVTNTPGFPTRWKTAAGEAGESVIADSVDGFLRCADRPDAVFVVNCDPGITYGLARSLLGRPKPALIAVDMVLRQPETILSRIACMRKGRLLRRVDHFIHYFRDTTRLDRVFGIPPGKSSFIPFKANLADGKGPLEPCEEGSYVLCLGRSLRDFDTFFSAVESLPFPAAIAQPNVRELAAHGARFTRPLSRLPPNVSILPDDNSTEAQLRLLGGAKLVVLPILKKTLVASGISTCLNAMLLGKCVIASEGPGTADVFGRELLVVPPEDPAALARMIRRAWEDDELRRSTAEAGREAARALGGEAELYQRMVERVVEWHRDGR